MPLSVRVEPQLRAWSVGAGALTTFGLLALIIAAGGFYAVVAFDVSQRPYELAIRTALGASAGAIVHALAMRTLLFTIAGIAGGLVLALVLGRVVQSLLFDVRATDPIVFACPRHRSDRSRAAAPAPRARQRPHVRALGGVNVKIALHGDDGVTHGFRCPIRAESQSGPMKT
jgi:ABC-type antimicrobial peptide transport system permease subunit